MEFSFSASFDAQTGNFTLILWNEFDSSKFLMYAKEMNWKHIEQIEIIDKHQYYDSIKMV